MRAGTRTGESSSENSSGSGCRIGRTRNPSNPIEARSQQERAFRARWQGKNGSRVRGIKARNVHEHPPDNVGVADHSQQRALDVR